ncbi:MAG: DUF169 domain-containing protein [Marinifilaceae bacterium]
MNVQEFIQNFREAFGEKAMLPIVFWYSDVPEAKTEFIGGCFFKGLQHVNNGETISLNAEIIGCGGGKFYTGFSEMPPFVPNFVSQKERYKETPDMVLEYVERLDVPCASGAYLNFLRVDKLIDFDRAEGLLFFATPDILSGLTTWAYFDNNDEDAVMAPFGSGCSVVVTQAINENRSGGKRTFIGLFDPSVRPYVDANILSFVIPMSRFRVMYTTMRNSCLFNTHAWAKVRERINE